MKKSLIFIGGIIVIVVVAFYAIFNFNSNNTNDDNEKLQKVKLAEVAHTIFYAPQYVAIEKGYFKDAGIDLELSLASGADKVTAAVLSGDANIGFCGSEATIYVYNGGTKDYLQTFAQATQKDGTFLVARENIKNFTLADLKGKTVVGGRAGGMPEMTFEYSLRENGIDPRKDLNIDTSVAFPAMSGSFIGGNGDFVTLFDVNDRK